MASTKNGCRISNKDKAGQGRGRHCQWHFQQKEPDAPPFENRLLHLQIKEEKV